MMGAFFSCLRYNSPHFGNTNLTETQVGYGMRTNKVEICGVDTSKLETLSEAEKRELLALSRGGDVKARSALVMGNLRLVLSVVGRFNPKHDCADDLFQVGCIGLMKAIDNFNLDMDVRFSTYAVPMIIGVETRSLRFGRGIGRTDKDPSRQIKSRRQQSLYTYREQY